MSDTEIVLPVGHRLLMRSSLDSTNAEALRQFTQGETGPLWILADQQSAGKGRSGRHWTSETGNLFASLLVTLPPSAMASIYQLSLVMGVAVHGAIIKSRCLNQPAVLRLKWPNDILIDRAKMGGILIESSSGQQGAAVAVFIGIGVNLVTHPQDTAAPATHLSLHGRAPERNLIFQLIAGEVAAGLGGWQEGEGFGRARKDWLERAGPLGETCSIHAGRVPVEGCFAGLDGDGALLLKGSDGEIRRFTFGDVTLSP